MTYAFQIRAIHRAFRNIIRQSLKAHGNKIHTFFLSEESKDTYEQSLRIETHKRFHDLIILDIHLTEDEKIMFTYFVTGDNYGDCIDDLKIEDLHIIVKWLQKHGFCHTENEIETCFRCGSTAIIRMAWVDHNNTERIIRLEEDLPDRFRCECCKKSHGIIKVDGNNLKEDYLDKWFNHLVTCSKERLVNRKRDPDEPDSWEKFSAHCKAFWQALSLDEKRRAWHEYEYFN